MSLKINLVQKYSSQFGNSQQQFTVTDENCKHFTSCKHYTSKYRKWLRNQHENNGYGISALRTNAMNYSITIKKNWNDAHNNKQLTMHN